MVGKHLERAGLGRVPIIAAVGIVACLVGWFWTSTEPAGEEPDAGWRPVIRANSDDDVQAQRLELVRCQAENDVNIKQQSPLRTSLS